MLEMDFQNGSRHGSDEIDVRMLVHQSQAGCIIGKGGLKIKELREVSRRIWYTRIRRLTRVIRAGHDIGFTIVTFDSVPRPPACSYDEFKPFSRPFIRSSLLMDNGVGFARSRRLPTEIRNRFRFRYFWTPAFRSILRRFIFTSITKYIYRGSSRDLTFILVVIIVFFKERKIFLKYRKIYYLSIYLFFVYFFG